MKGRIREYSGPFYALGPGENEDGTRFLKIWSIEWHRYLSSFEECRNSDRIATGRPKPPKLPRLPGKTAGESRVHTKVPARPKSEKEPFFPVGTVLALKGRHLCSCVRDPTQSAAALFHTDRRRCRLPLVAFLGTIYSSGTFINHADKTVPTMTESKKTETHRNTRANFLKKILGIVTSRPS
jgi:hypothetical protein